MDEPIGRSASMRLRRSIGGPILLPLGAALAARLQLLPPLAPVKPAIVSRLSFISTFILEEFYSPPTNSLPASRSVGRSEGIFAQRDATPCKRITLALALAHRDRLDDALICCCPAAAACSAPPQPQPQPQPQRDSRQLASASLATIHDDETGAGAAIEIKNCTSARIWPDTAQAPTESSDRKFRLHTPAAELQLRVLGGRFQSEGRPKFHCAADDDHSQ